MMTSHCGVTLAIICWMIVFFKQTQTSNGSELSFSPCGGVGKICRCRGTTADCSRNGGKLTFIPAFSRRITALNISFNRLSSIRSENFFKNVTELTELDISGNYMSTVKTGAFKVCTRLNILYSRKNKMNYSTLGEILDIPTLRVLDLTHCSLRNMPNDLFHRNVTSRLTTLILDKNMNTRMNMSAVKPLRYLKHLSLSQSLVSGVVPDHLPFLEKLEITFTFLSSFPLTCDDRGEAFYPTLVYMDMNGNRVTSVPSPFFVEPYLCLPNLTVLKLNHNCLITLDMTVFKHLNNLRELSSTRSSIENIYPEYLRSLRRLDVHNNLLQHFPETCVVGSRSFYPRLSYLDIGLNEIRFFSYPNPAPTICLPWLTELVIKYPEQDELDMSFFKHLTNLTKLNAKNGNIDMILADFMPSLETLQLSHNKLTQIPKSCSPKLQSFFPRLSTLDLSYNSIRIAEWHDWIPRTSDLDVFRDLVSLIDEDKSPLYPETICLPKLRGWNLEHNKLAVTKEMFSSRKLPALRYLNLRNAGVEAMQSPFSNPSVHEIDLSQNKLDFASSGQSSVPEDLFTACTNLSFLHLGGNNFRGISQTRLKRLLSPLVSAQTVYLGDTNLDKIGKETFAALRNVEEIHLERNKVSSIPDGAFDGLEYLTDLHLEENSIFSISESTFSWETRRRLKTLNLSHNPFECTCSLLWFYQWMTHEPALFDYHNPYTRYDCNNMPGVHLATFFHIQQKCLLSHSASSIVIAFFTLFIIVLTLTTVFFRYRWRIRLALYEAFRGDPLARWRQRPPEDFLYDLFVCYDSEDSRWVLNHLMPVLEEQMELRLCVHQRDFIPGKNITDNIVDSLAVSKRVLALFSPNFAESQWCNFELELCLTHVVEGDDVMVLVLLEEVPARDMSGAMRALMKTTTYIEWDNDPEAVASFWRRMTLALVDILPGVNQ